MNLIYIKDAKGREFEIEYYVTKGRRAMFDPNFGNWFPSDPDELEVKGACVYFYKGDRTKTVELTEKQLYKYLSQSYVEDMIFENLSFANYN